MWGSGIGRTRRRAIAAATTAALTITAFLAFTPGTARSDVVTTTVTPVADAYVESSTPTTNYGTSTRLIADASPVRESFLRFDLTGITGPLQQARLRIHVADITDSQSPNGGNVARVNDTTWNENTVTYNTRPTSWDANVANLGAVSRNTWVEVTVTSAVTSGGLLTLGIRSPNGDGAYYDSRHTTNAPQLIVTTDTGTTTSDAVGAACTGQLVASNLATIADPAINEPSGMDVGVANPNIFWIHNDSGDTPRVFALNSAGQTQRIYMLGGAAAQDWEDIAIGGGPVAGTPYLYLADVGDNTVTRVEVAVYRVPEPAVVAGAPTTLTGVDTLRLRYPDGAHNAEALLADPVTGALVIIAKTTNGGPANIYTAPAGLAGGSLTTLTAAGTLSLPTGPTNLVTGADISHDGTQIAVRTYAAVLLWNRDPATPMWTPLASAPCTGPAPPEIKGEAIAFDADGRGYTTLNESAGATLHTYQAP